MEEELNKAVVEDTAKAAEEFSTGDVLAAHGSQLGWQESEVADEMMDYLIDTMCNAIACTPTGRAEQQLQDYTIEYLADHLPAVNFVTTFYSQLIISGGIEAKDAYNQRKLDDWLASRNALGQTNRDIIADAIKNSLMYGYSGIRMSMGNFYLVNPSQFKIWKLPYAVNDLFGRLRVIPGIKSVAFYEVNLKQDWKVEKKGKNRDRVIHVGNNRYTIEQVIKEKMLRRAYDGSYYIGTDENDAASVSSVWLEQNRFCHLRHSDDGEYGRSPLSYDRLRTNLLIDLLKNFRDEILNDGSDYIMWLRARAAAGASLTGLLSAGATENALKAAQDTKMTKAADDKQMAAAKKLAMQMKKSAKTRMAIAKKDYVEDIVKLEGTVRLPDYLAIYNDAKDVVADIYGIHSLLVGGKSSGWNTGMSSMLEFTMDKTIKPFQQRYAEQLSRYICEAAGIRGPVKFAEYKMLDDKTRAEIDKIRAEAEKSTADAAKIAKETKLLNKDGVNGRPATSPESTKNAGSSSIRSTKKQTGRS